MDELTDSDFDVKTTKGTVVIDFFAPWCGPCKMIASSFEELSTEYKNIKFAKVNVDNSSKLATRFNVLGVPSILILKDGNEIGRITGFQPKSALKSWIDAIAPKG